MTKDQINFLNNHKSLKTDFKSLKYKTKPISQVKLLKWLISMISDFFGPFVEIIKEKKVARIDKNNIDNFYNYTIDLSLWLEFMIVNIDDSYLYDEHKKVLEKISTDLKFTFKDLHGYEGSNEFFEIYNEMWDLLLM